MHSMNVTKRKNVKKGNYFRLNEEYLRNSSFSWLKNSKHVAVTDSKTLLCCSVFAEVCCTSLSRESRILCCQSPDETYFWTKPPATPSYSIYCVLGITQGRRTHNMKWQAACFTPLVRHTAFLKYRNILSDVCLFYNNHYFCWLIWNTTNISTTVTGRNQCT
jgi:hypothetical protein